MSTALDISSVTANLPSAALKAPQPTANVAAAKKAAEQFESVFVSEFLGQMFEGISTDGPFGGGQGEAMFRSLLVDEYGKQVTAQGGFGLSQAVTRQLIQMQSQAQSHGQGQAQGQGSAQDPVESPAQTKSRGYKS